MKVPQRLVLSFLPLITLATMANVVLASCPRFIPGPPCQEFWRVDSVFIAVADRVVNTPNTTPFAIGPYSQSTVYLTVEEWFRGAGGTALVLNLDHCGERFKEKERYLVYAYRNPNTNELDVRAGNTRTRPLSEAKEDLDYIRGLTTAEPGSRVFGKVTQHTLNAKESQIAFESLKDIKVTLEGNNERQEAITDSNGRYEFKRVPAGSYKLRADIPAYLTSREEQLKLKGGECVPLDIGTWRKAQIAVRVVDGKRKPLVGVAVSLVSADANPDEIFLEDKDKIAWAFGYSDEQGRLAFSYLAPGRYLLVINRSEFERSRTTKWTSLPRLFYPGVNDLSGATVIVVTKDQESQEYTFNLPIP